MLNVGPFTPPERACSDSRQSLVFSMSLEQSLILLKITGVKVLATQTCTCCANTLTRAPLSKYSYITFLSTFSSLQAPFPLPKLCLSLSFTIPLFAFLYTFIYPPPPHPTCRFNEVCSCVILQRSGPLTSLLWLRCVSPTKSHCSREPLLKLAWHKHTPAANKDTFIHLTHACTRTHTCITCQHAEDQPVMLHVNVDSLE